MVVAVVVLEVAAVMVYVSVWVSERPPAGPHNRRAYQVQDHTCQPKTKTTKHKQAAQNFLVEGVNRQILSMQHLDILLMFLRQDWNLLQA